MEKKSWKHKKQKGSTAMRGFAYFLISVVALTGAPTQIGHASGEADGEASPIFGIKIPSGYRDWRVVSVAHEAGKNNDLRVVLGNDIAIKAFREGKLPYPERHDRCPAGLELRSVCGKQQSLWACPIFRCRVPHQRSVRRQGLKKIRLDGWLGFRAIQGRKTCRCGRAGNLLCLSRAY